MDFRKIIAFGKSSFVVSLPKFWLETHSLNKGDIVYLEEDGDDLRVMPGERQLTEIAESHIRIDADKKSFDLLQREICAAYVSGYNQIVVTGKKISEFSSMISDIGQNLIALEVVEHGADRIVLKDFTTVQGSKITDSFRKLDLTIRSIFSDIKNVEFTSYDDVLQRRQLIIRLYLYLLKLFKSCLKNPRQLRSIDLNGGNFLSFHSFNYSAYRIGLWLWTITKYLKDAPAEQKEVVCSCVALLEEYYLVVMKIIFTNKIDSALVASEKRTSYLEDLDSYCMDKNIPARVTNAIWSIAQELHQMCHHVYS